MPHFDRNGCCEARGFRTACPGVNGQPVMCCTNFWSSLPGAALRLNIERCRYVETSDGECGKTTGRIETAYPKLQGSKQYVTLGATATAPRRSVGLSSDTSNDKASRRPDLYRDVIVKDEGVEVVVDALRSAGSATTAYPPGARVPYRRCRGRGRRYTLISLPPSWRSSS